MWTDTQVKDGEVYRWISRHIDTQRHRWTDGPTSREALTQINPAVTQIRNSSFVLALSEIASPISQRNLAAEEASRPTTLRTLGAHPTMVSEALCWDSWEPHHSVTLP